MISSITPLNWASLSAIFFGLMTGFALAEDPFTHQIPAREVPLPATVSPELLKLIARPVPPIQQMPTTPEGWKALQKEADAANAKISVELAKTVGATVEPVVVGGVKCYRVSPKEVHPERADKLIVHVHGGACVFNAGLAGTAEAVILAETARTPVLTIDYRMPPDHPFPAAPDDVVAVWKALVQERDPKTVAMGGTSAGAGLTMTAMLRCKAENLPVPAALFLGTPGANLTKGGDSMFLNAEVDHILGRYEGRIEACLKLYGGEHDLADPLLSPIFGDFTGWPPAILITGTRDLLMSPTIITHRKMRAAGIPADLHVYEGMSHANYLWSYPAPESIDVFSEVAAFFARHWKP